jgi:hypothetical protein
MPNVYFDLQLKIIPFIEQSSVSKKIKTFNECSPDIHNNFNEMIVEVIGFSWISFFNTKNDNVSKGRGR